MTDASDYQSFAVVSEILEPPSVWDEDLRLAQHGSILFYLKIRGLSSVKIKLLCPDK